MPCTQTTNIVLPWFVHVTEDGASCLRISAGSHDNHRGRLEVQSVLLSIRQMHVQLA